MRKKYIPLTFIAIMLLGLWMIFKWDKTAEEAITYFPLQPDVSFLEINTSLSLLGMDKDGYKLQWRTSSTLDRKAYLRQDLALLFSNGRLKAKTAKWVAETASINQVSDLKEKKSAYFEAVTYHHAEIHSQDNRISSSYKISGDYLYVIYSPFSPLQSFRAPTNKETGEWKQMIDTQISTMHNNTLKKGAKTYGIQLERYIALPLTDLENNYSELLKPWGKNEQQKILGRLWEGIYKNYYLAITLPNGKKVDSIGSTEPLILVSKDQSHLLILFETAKDVPILLRQKL